MRSRPARPSVEFFARYSALLAGTAVTKRRPAEGTIAAVIADYKATEAYKQLAPKTQRHYARHLDRFAPFDHWPVEDFKRRHIKAIQEPLNKTPRTAKYFAQVCSLLFAHAIELDLIEVNPASKLKRLDKADPYKAWTDEECATFEGSNPPQALCTAYMLGRYTGQRGGDILRWTRIRWARLPLQAIEDGEARSIGDDRPGAAAAEGPSRRAPAGQYGDAGRYPGWRRIQGEPFPPPVPRRFGRLRG